MIRTPTSVLVLIVVLTGCNFADSFTDTEPTPHSYSSVITSKSHNVFVSRYNPLSSFITIEGVSFKIHEAWAEHPHRWAGNDFISGKNLAFVMTFENTKNKKIDLKDYTKDLGGGPSKLWFFLSEKEYLSDTLIIKYKDRKLSKDEKTLYLVKTKGE